MVRFQTLENSLLPTMTDYAYSIIIGLITAIILFCTLTYAGEQVNSINELSFENNREKNLRLREFEINNSLLNITYE